jgi:putative membrane protein
VSLRTYTGPAPTRRPGVVAKALVWGLALLTIGLQIAYPLSSDAALSRLAVWTVLAFCGASLVHAWVYRGFLWALGFFVVVAGIGLLAEAVGTRTGWPFGEYDYTDVLGFSVLGVPGVVPLAWVMMLYPTYVAATFLVQRAWVVALVSGFSMMAWDVFLDPMMVQLGAWHWQADTGQAPGVPGIPLVNFAGWFVVAAAMTAVVSLLPRRKVPVGQPATLYLWTYVSATLGAAVFFDRASVALVGGVAMGLVALPFAFRLWVDRA